MRYESDVPTAKLTTTLPLIGKVESSSVVEDYETVATIRNHINNMPPEHDKMHIEGTLTLQWHDGLKIFLEGDLFINTAKQLCMSISYLCALRQNGIRETRTRQTMDGLPDLIEFGANLVNFYPRSREHWTIETLHRNWSVQPTHA